MDYNINFPHLHIYLSHVGKSISVGNFSIAYYGIVISIGIIIAGLFVCREAKHTGQNPDDYIDLAMISVVCSLIGARIYYVVFRWDLYKNNLLEIFDIRSGGLAIYGGIIAAIVTVYVFSKKRKISFPIICDTAVLGLLIGQIIGRWGNFFNREAFGDYTDGLFAMQIPVSAVRSSEITDLLYDNSIVSNGITYIQVHPTFLYESLWNLTLLFLLLIIRKHKKFNGEIFLLYLAGYGFGRTWIESLRTDQLKIPVFDIPVSMILSIIMIGISLTCFFIARYKAMKK